MSHELVFENALKHVAVFILSIAVSEKSIALRPTLNKNDLVTNPTAQHIAHQYIKQLCYAGWKKDLILGAACMQHSYL